MAVDEMMARDRSIAWRSIAPLIALCVVMLLWAGGALFVIARETDRSDALRAGEAVQRTFEAMNTRVAQAAQINGIDSSVARSISMWPATRTLLLSEFNFAWPETIGYYGVLVLEADGRPLFGTFAGKDWHGAEFEATAAIVRRVADGLRPGSIGARSMLLRGAHGEAMIVAASNVLPKPADRADDLADMPRRRLIMVQPVDKLLARMTPLIGAKDFRIVDRGEGPNTLALPTANGAPLIFEWQPRTPGRAAVLRWAPAMTVALLIAAMLLGIAMRSSLAATRALQHLADCDPLTGLPNRTRLLDALGSQRGST